MTAVFSTGDGNYYALNLTEQLGVERSGGFLRIGLVHYNTPDEVGRLPGGLAGDCGSVGGVVSGVCVDSFSLSPLLGLAFFRLSTHGLRRGLLLTPLRGWSIACPTFSFVPWHRAPTNTGNKCTTQVTSASLPQGLKPAFLRLEAARLKLCPSQNRFFESSFGLSQPWLPRQLSDGLCQLLG